MPRATRTFRIFVSSTFEDMAAERNALQADVFPRLRDLCAEHDARFQAIDLRLGRARRSHSRPADNGGLPRGAVALPDHHAAAQLHRAARRPLRVAATAG